MDLTQGYLLGDTGALSQEHLRIAQILADYDPDLELCYIPAADLQPGEDPFALFHTHNGFRYLVMTIPAKDMNQSLIAKVFSSAVAENDVLGKIEANDAAMRAMELAAEMERREERREFMGSVLRSPKSTYKHAGKVYH